MFYKRIALKSFRKIQRKTPVLKSILMKLQVESYNLQSANFIEIKLWQEEYLVNFQKFFRAPFSQDTPREPLL